MDEVADSLSNRRKRRRQRRLIIISGFLVFSIGMAWFFESQATTTVLVARYAEPAQSRKNDPGLSKLGRSRAGELSRVLGKVDVVAGVDAIFVAPLRRAAETSEPLATLNEAPVHLIDEPVNVEHLVQRILTEYKGKIVLVVTESDVMQPLIAEMHGSKKLAEIRESEHDNLFVVSIPWFGKVKTLQLKYGQPFEENTGPSG